MQTTMALTKDDLNAIRSVIREETSHLATKGDIAGVRGELSATEGRLVRKIEEEAERLAQIAVREFRRVHRRTEALARHVGYTFEPELDERG